MRYATELVARRYFFLFAHEPHLHGLKLQDEHHGAEFAFLVSVRNLIRSLTGGFIGGLGATAAMSLAMLGAKRFGLLGEPPPRKIVNRVLWRTRQRPVRERHQNALAVGAHFGFGGLMGALFGAAEPRLASRVPRPLAGMLFGSAVWALSYAGVLPRLGIMRPPRKDRPLRPAVMLASHWIYGAVLGESAQLIRRTVRLAAPR